MNCLIWHVITKTSSSGRASFPPPPSHRIVCLGRLWIRNLKISFDFSHSENEKELIEQLMSSFNECLDLHEGVIVTGFGKEFTNPVLVSSAFANLCSLENYLESQKGEDREKTFDVWSWMNYHFKDKISFESMAQFCGMPARPDKDVAALISKGKWKVLRGKLAIDCFIIAAAFLRAQVVRGKLSTKKEGYPRVSKLLRLFFEKFNSELVKEYCFNLAEDK